MHEQLKYIIREPLVTSKKPPVLFMLHGYGSNEQDLFSFASHLPKELLIVSAQAPLSMGFGAYAWFEIDFDGEKGSRTNTEQAIQAVERIENLVNEITKKYDVDLNKRFMLGFSQGSILSYAYAFKNPEVIKNFITLSGYINHEIINEFKTKEAYKDLDFFVSHGTQDQILPIEWARQIPKILDEYQIKYVYKEYPVGHGVSPENFNDFKNWIENRL